jgi:hypothetical protein
MTRFVPLLPLGLLLACTDVEDPATGHSHSHSENELITGVTLTFTPDGAGTDLVFTASDPENDGDPVIDPIVVPEGAYDVAVTFANEAGTVVEDMTPEVADEDDEHQVFFTGSGVEGPATGTNAAAVVTHAYDDTDADGLPVGLSNTFTTRSTGTGELIVTLRHLPPENGNPTKVAGLAETVGADGFEAIGGDNDVETTFTIEVQ